MDRSGRALALPDSGSFVTRGCEPGEAATVQERVQASQRTRHGFIDILNFGFQWGIPSVDLNRVGVAESSGIVGSRIAYSLGSGHTATVIRHETDDEAPDLVPPNTMIALKRFVQNPLPDHAEGEAHDERSARSQTYQAILRELAVFCHAKLSEHPNIVKLLFLGWQSNSPFPLLAMELGDYGSLDYVLRAPGIGLSTIQKANVTMDVALGLHALHDNGFVHGDLKPGNIVILRHPDPERQIIAKLTDFGGASRADGDDCPGFVTHLWCAPEVLHGDGDVQWDKCDIYSYGLVVASIWSRPEMFETERQASSCILSALVPEALDGEDHENFLFLMKSVQTSSPDSALQRILRLLSDLGESFAGDILRASLTPRFWQRPSICEITMREFVDFAPEIGRDLRSEMAFEPQTKRFTKASTSLFKVWSESFRQRPREFQEHVLYQLEDEVGSGPDVFDADVEDIPEHIDETVSADEYLEILHQGVVRLVRSAAGDGTRQFIEATSTGRLCYHIALCYLYPIGATFSLGTALQWLRSAALGGYNLATLMAPIMHHHYPQERTPFRQERLFLALSGLSRSLICMDILALKWPSHYHAVLKVIQQRGLGVFDLDRNFNDTYHMSILSFYRAQAPSQAASLDLIGSLVSYNLEWARQLLANGTDASIIDSSGVSALHALTRLRDVDAVPLAREIVEAGADLNVMADMSTGIWSTSTGSHQKGSVLSSAICCGQIGFARELLSLHVEFKVEIKDFMRILVGSLAYWQHGLAQLLFELIETHPSLCHLTPLVELAHGTSAGLLEPRKLLVVAMDCRDLRTLENRVYHGRPYEEAYANTIRLLLRKGADPTAGEYLECPLYRCLLSDDHVALRCFVHYLKNDMDGDPLPHVIDPGHCRGRPWSVNDHTGLQTCIYFKSPRCFNILLREFPLLLEEQNARGLTALHSATFYAEDTPLLKTLLARGANVLTVSKDHSTPLMRALRNKNLEAANLIAVSCSSDEMDILFRRQPDTGRSLFSRMIDSWLRDRDPKLLESFKWIIERGGAQFYGRASIVGPHIVQIPFWNDLLARVRPPSKAWQLNDLGFANLLFATFPDQINVLQQDGRGPLHVATWYGHVEIVRSLLRQHGANVNLEFGVCEYHPGDPRGMLGRTPLNQAIIRSKSSGIPDEVRRGGVEEVSRWKDDCAVIITLLREAGGRSGSGATFSQAMEALALDETLNITVNSVNKPEPFDHDDVWRGDWPHTLPRDNTSVELPDLERLSQDMNAVRSLVGPWHVEGATLGREGREALLPEGYRDQLKERAGAMRLLWRIPPNWEVRIVDRGRYYFVDHNTRSTTWIKPPLTREIIEDSSEPPLDKSNGQCEGFT